MSHAFPPTAGPELTSLARQAIGHRLKVAGFPAVGPPAGWMRADGACFVTLTSGGALRGCIGSLEAYRPLGQDVVRNAQAAAFEDPRFPPLAVAEFEHVAIEVSVLSVPEPFEVATEADLLDGLHPGTDGLIFAARGRRATFLPQVWDDLPDRRVFVAQLKRKAGLAADYWGDDVRLWRYRVTAFTETSPGKPTAE